ncbi:Calcium-dependent secretion activator 2-like [Balamuthia mandrillaris]
MVYMVPGVQIPNTTGDGFDVWKEIVIGFTLPFVSNSACRIHSARHLCPTYYRECIEVLSPNADPDNYTPDQVARVGPYVCRDLCLEYIPFCETSVPAEFQEAFLNCETPNPVFFGATIYDIFPPDGNVTVQAVAPNGDTWDYEYQCFDRNRDVSCLFPFLLLLKLLVLLFFFFFFLFLFFFSKLTT